MSGHQIRLVVSDMAGTTVADDGLVEAAFQEAAAELGVHPGDERHAAMLADVRATMGESKISVFRRLFGNEADAVRANLAFEAAYDRMVDAGHCAPLPGAETALRALRAAGYTVVLTTGFSGATQQRILASLGWDGLAHLALCPADAGGRGRPYPDLVLTALTRSRGADDVREVAVIGDTGYDMRSGLTAGAAVRIGVLTGAHAEPRLRAEGATDVVASIAAVPDLLASLR